jgi:hypothetical protein
MIALGLLGCASLADQPSGDLAGCYQFRYDEGAKALGLPWGIVLLDQPIEPGWLVGTRFEGVMKAETATSATGRADHPFGYWRMVGDSLEIGHPSGFTGYTVTLLPEGRDLVGAGRAIGDAGRPGETRPTLPVTANRVVCGAT